MNKLENLEGILKRAPLQEYSREYRQNVGWVSVEKSDPHKPGLNAWLMNNWSPTYIRVPIIVSGKRIAVINQDWQSLEAISVDHYDETGGKTSALARVGSVSVVWNRD